MINTFTSRLVEMVKCLADSFHNGASRKVTSRKFILWDLKKGLIFKMYIIRIP